MTEPQPLNGEQGDRAIQLRDLASGWVKQPDYRHHYRPTSEIDTAGVHVGWLEIADDAEVAQRLLDCAQIKDGYPQGDGDIDTRVARAVWELIEVRGRLSAIEAAHCQGEIGGGMVDGYCVECERQWPCPTFLWASGQRDSSACWDPSDDEPTS